MSDQYLFTRRTFLQTAAATTAGLALGTPARAAVHVRRGQGHLHARRELGHSCRPA